MLFKKKNHHSLNRSDIIEAKKEQLKTLVKKHKKALYLSLVAVLALLVTSIAYQSYNQAREKKYSAILQQILIDAEKGNNESMINSLKNLYEDGSVPAGIKSLVAIKYAAALLNDDKVDEAVNIYIETNKTKKFDPYIRELSGLLALKSMIDANSSIFDDRIAALTEDLEKNCKILKYFVIEQKAIFEWNRGNDATAAKIFQSLIDNPEVSGTIKNRAKEMIGATSKNASEKKKAK